MEPIKIDPALKTYSHLMDGMRIPSEYEVATTKLHYYTNSGFEIDVPLKAWYEKYQTGSPFTCGDWEKFSDPLAMTYGAYVSRRRKQEIFVETILERIGNGDDDRRFSAQWLNNLEEVLATLRFVFHGFQMIAAYIGQMAPCGRITAAALFQSGDEIRRVHRIAYRMTQIRRVVAGFGDNSRVTWEENPGWQPLRKVLEELLATYDWGEVFIAHNLVLKPVVDELFLALWGDVAARNGDHLLKEILTSFYEDSLWQRNWSRELLNTVLSDSPASLIPARDWFAKWADPVMAGVRGVAPYFEGVDVVGILRRFLDCNPDGATIHALREGV